LVCVEDEALTTDGVEALRDPEVDVWLELLPPQALNSPAKTTESAASRIATIHLLAVGIVTQAACRRRARRR
jgi:hypothetical protein